MTDEQNIVELVKERNLIEEVIKTDGYELPTRGRYRKAPHSNGLVVDAKNQTYHWNGRAEYGDVIAWVQQHQRLDFKGAVEWLAQRAGLPAPTWGHGDQVARLAARAREDALTVAARVFASWFWRCPEAQEYAQRRGWTLQRDQDGDGDAGTAVRAMLGYSGQGTEAERDEMRRELSAAGVDLRSPVAVAITGMRGNVSSWAAEHNNLELNEDWIINGYIPGMVGRGRLVYPHLHNGRVTYLSGRGIAEKMHYNLPEALVGKRQPFFNHVYSAAAEAVVVVEGQADALSLAQWDIAAVALAGVKLDDNLVALLCSRHRVLYVGLDMDIAGLINSWKTADALGPMARLLCVRDPLGMVFPATAEMSQRERELAERANGIARGLARVAQVPLPDKLRGWDLEDGEPHPVKDANDLLRAMSAHQVPAVEQTGLIGAVITLAPTFAEFAAAWAGGQSGAARDEATRQALRVISRLEDLEFAQYRAKLSKHLGVGVRELTNMLKALEADEKQKEAEGEPIYTWGEYVDGWLLEYLYDAAKHKAALAWRDPDGNIISGDSVTIGGRRYEPYPPNESMRIGTILFPSKLGDKKSLRELVTYVEMFIRSVYLLPSDRLARLISYFVMSTWVYDSFSSLIYLRLMGDAGSGKSEFMFRIGLITYRSISANGADSTSSLFRMVQRYRGTVLIDEADLEKSDTSQDMIKFYNLGAFKGRPILRSVEVTLPDGKRDFEVQGFQTFCPKILTLRKDFRDDAVGSRSLTIKLQPRETNELVAAGIPLQITSMIQAKAQALRNLMLRWRLETWQPDIEIDPSFYDLTISARLNQVAGSLLMLARDDAEQQEEIRQNLREYYRETILTRSMTVTARVIEALWKIWKYPDLHKTLVKADGEGHLIKIGDITRITNELIDEMNDTEENDDGGSDKKNQKGVKPQRIGWILREELQFQVTERRRDGFWVIWSEPRLQGVSMRFGVDPEQIGPPPEKPRPSQGKLEV